MRARPATANDPLSRLLAAAREAAGRDELTATWLERIARGVRADSDEAARRPEATKNGVFG